MHFLTSAEIDSDNDDEDTQVIVDSQPALSINPSHLP